MNQNLNTYLSKWYAIPKGGLDASQLHNHISKLTVTECMNRTTLQLGIEPKQIKLYTQDEHYLYVPKHYGIRHYGIPQPENINFCEGAAISSSDFNGKLRENQLQVVSDAQEGFRETDGGMISIECGGGKTVLACYLISVLKLKTLVLVHQTVLLNQWKERIGQFLPGVTIGLIQQNKVIDGDVVIGMIPSVASHKYEKSVWENFGFVVIDEAHHVCAPTLFRCLYLLGDIRYKLGLSATPKRSDGFDIVLKEFIGPFLHVRKQKLIDTVYAVQILHTHIYQKEIHFRHKPEVLNSQGMINDVCRNLARQQYLVVIIAHLLLPQYANTSQSTSQTRRRKLIVLSDRRGYLFELQKCLQLYLEEDDDMQFDPCVSTGMIVGGMKEKDRKESVSCDVIFATYQMCSEGLDIPSLDTLIMCTSKSSITQCVGRILRQHSTKCSPLIIDWVDNFSLFKAQGYKRRAFYRGKDTKFEYLNVLLDTFKFERHLVMNILDKVNSFIQ